MKIKTLLFAAVTALAAVAAHADIQEGVDYVVLEKTVPQKNPDKIEVLEFFSYTCVHCKNLDKVLLPYTQNLPADTYFRQEHVVWNDSMMSLARLLAAVNATGVRHYANPLIFDALFTTDAQGRPKHNLTDANVVRTWAAQQGTWGKSLAEAYNSPAAAAAAQQMQKTTLEYGIDSTPQVIVGGKYRAQIRNMGDAPYIIDDLIAKVRAERKMPAPAARKALKSQGARLAVEAAR